MNQCRSVFRASVVIPVLNSPDKLCAALEGLCSQQTSFPFETVVVDDGSTIDLMAVRDKFASLLSLTWIRLERNGGPARARNIGVEAATGEIILFTDADCVPACDWVQKMVFPFEDSSVVGAKGAYVSNQSDLWARLAQLEFEERYQLLMSQSDIDFIDTYSGAYRKDVFIAAGGFDCSFSRPDNEDVDLSFRVKKIGGRFVFVADALVEHTHREGWSAYARLKFGRGFWRMKVYRKHPEKACNDSYTPSSLKLQMALIALLPFVLVMRGSKFIWKSCWLFSCVPMMRIALPERPLLAVMTPIFCFVRALALISGMLCGIYEA
ncbi:MAG: glycosyltransferase, partial [Erysipelotrichia bacterium]|nr:glycosyltransferase [Erysipelotrichia bacterium]